MVSHSKKLGSCPEDSLLTFSQGKPLKEFEKGRDTTSVGGIAGVRLDLGDQLRDWCRI